MGTSQRCADKRSPLKRFSTTLFRPMNQHVSHFLPSSVQIKPTGTLWPWSRAACVWCVWTSQVAWRPGILPGPCWCCMVVAVRRMGRIVGMTSQCRWVWLQGVSQTCLFCQLIHRLSVCGRIGRGVWGRVRAFAFWGNRSGSVLRIRDEIHVRQSQIYCHNKCCWGRQIKTCCCCSKQSSESAKDRKDT